MMLYHSLRPHPVVGAGREVRMFLHEKGLAVPMTDVDMMSGENRQQAFLAKNPTGQLPALELDDGRVLAEGVAICELFEDLHADPPLIGRSPEEKAQTRMWLRRCEFGITENIVNGFRFAEGKEFWKGRGRVVPEAADGLKAIARDKLRWLDGAMAGNEFIAGDRFTLADIVLFVALEFAEMVGQPLDPELARVAAWKARVASRPSAAASLCA
jgi:glutathione S-transferase